MTGRAQWKWNSGDACPACDISFCPAHRPGSNLDERPFDPKLDQIDTRGLRLVPMGRILDECWVLDQHSNRTRRTEAGQIVHDAKFYGAGSRGDTQGVRRLGRTMGHWLNSLGHPTHSPYFADRSLHRFDVVVPIPSPRQRRPNVDGLSELPSILAEEIAYATAAPFVIHGLTVRPGLPQMKQCPLADRSALLAGAFSTTLDFTGIRVLLVDDVVQTGSTMTEAARVLKAAGATEVTGYAATAEHR